MKGEVKVLLAEQSFDIYVIIIVDDITVKCKLIHGVANTSFWGETLCDGVSTVQWTFRSRIAG